MKVVKTEIIPVKLWYFNSQTKKIFSSLPLKTNENLDYESIAFFATTGFFFNDSTYYKNIKVIPPASITEVDDDDTIISNRSYWEWYYNPIIRDVEEAVEVFKIGFERNLFKDIKNKKVIFPLSGGIDSRTIAAALPEGMNNIQTYSYEFENGVNEVMYGKAIAKAKKFPFQELTIPNGYLWNNIDQLAKIVNYQTEFTHSRQISVIDKLEQFGDIFVLGHGGEIFKAPKVNKNFSVSEIRDHLYNMFVSKEGLEVGEVLWKTWGLKGTIQQYIKDVFMEHLQKIHIKEANPKFRAFIYKYVAHRKNQVNVNIFGRNKEICLPFLNQDVLNGLCHIHEDILTDRKVQIEYIKQKSPAVAAISWQNFYPLNLYNYKNYNKLQFLPIRAANVAKRVVMETITGKKLITRNWENQLLGKENDKQLQKHFFKSTSDNELIPQQVFEDVYFKFKSKDPKSYNGVLGTLLTLSKFQTDLKTHNKVEFVEQGTVNA